jgi:hypothetical protein
LPVILVIGKGKNTTKHPFSIRGIIILCGCGAEKKAVPGINELPCQGRGAVQPAPSFGKQIDI